MSRREATIKTREEWISKREAQFRIQQVPVTCVCGERERERERERGKREKRERRERREKKIEGERERGEREERERLRDLKRQPIWKPDHTKKHKS